MNRDVPILVVEDDILDVKNIRRAFTENRVLNPIHVVTDGEQAIEYLFSQGQFQDRERYPRPGLILLDLNLPRLSGLQVLERYKADPNLRRIPAIVLTTSDEETDLVRSYAMGVAGYILKPVVFANFVEAIRRFDLYWSLCEVPPQ